MARMLADGDQGWARAEDGNSHVEVVRRAGRWVLVADGVTVVPGRKVHRTLDVVVERRTKVARRVRVTGTTHAARTAPKDED